MDEEIVGGCEGNYIGKSIAVLAVIVMIIFVYYLYKFAQDSKLFESMCGGTDQMCGCSGNETFSISGDDRLMKTARGY